MLNQMILFRAAMTKTGSMQLGKEQPRARTKFKLTQLDRFPALFIGITAISLASYALANGGV